MTCPRTAFPLRDEGEALHRRLCAADATAPADVVLRYLPALVGSLKRRNRRVDEHLLQTAAEQALFDYVTQPTRFDPTRTDLGAYLGMAARADLANLLRQERRHHRGRVAWISVELGPDGGNREGKESRPGEPLEREEEIAHDWSRLGEIIEAMTEQERRVLELMRQGEQATDIFARALGLKGLPRLEQERQVRRVKDRIMRRLQRGRSAS